jgi:predicted DNA-binding transcriptional regulator AlpA
MSAKRKLLRASTVKAERYDGVSSMWLWRRRQDPRFPRPVKIGNRNFFFEDELDAYDAAVAAEREVSDA